MLFGNGDADGSAPPGVRAGVTPVMMHEQAEEILEKSTVQKATSEERSVLAVFIEAVYVAQNEQSRMKHQLTTLFIPLFVHLRNLPIMVPGPLI